jgi:thiamine kinase-like enzyme
MLDKATEKFQIFNNKIEKNLEKFKNGVIKENYKMFIEIMNTNNYHIIKNFIENYQQLFAEIFPKNGLFVLNHNDVHRLNIMYGKEKEMYILDHEYAALNLIGIDIVNYMIEKSFDYTVKTYPYYEFNKSEINFTNYFETFKRYLKTFELSHETELKNEVYSAKFKKAYSYKYFLRVICVISLFWYLYSVIYFNFGKLCEMNSFNYFSHALDRLYIFEKAYKELKNLKSNTIIEI